MMSMAVDKVKKHAYQDYNDKVDERLTLFKQIKRPQTEYGASVGQTPKQEKLTINFYQAPEEAEPKQLEAKVV